MKGAPQQGGEAPGWLESGPEEAGPMTTGLGQTLRQGCEGGEMDCERERSCPSARDAGAERRKKEIRGPGQSPVRRGRSHQSWREYDR